MASHGLRRALDRLRQTLTTAETNFSDAQLLRHFLAGHDEAAFAVLVRRHGPMVLGVCQRVLGHRQDAEDAFQATFLVLARRAGSVLRRQSLGSWLYAVAYHASLRARSVNARRRARERQVEQMPHPEVASVEPQDWQSLLDQELSRLPEKYRTPVILCDLEGRTRKEVARQLAVPEGTLSSRLATARRILAKRLSRYGLSLSAGALAMALSERASATIPVSLASVTVKVAVLAAAGDLSVVSTSVGFLVKGAFQAMFLAKLKLAVVTMMVVVALGASGLVYRASGQPATTAERKLDRKPRSELEALRRENELLKLNLEVVLEKVRAQEAELRALKGRAEQVRALAFSPDGRILASVADDRIVRLWDPSTGKQLQQESGLNRAWKKQDKEELRRAVDALEKALKELREQLKKQEVLPRK